MSALAHVPHDEGLHDRLRRRDPGAADELAQTYLGPLARGMIRSFPRVDPHLCEQAAEDAILGLIGRPASYDPARGELGAYLRMSACGDLLNTLKRQRHRSRARRAAQCALMPHVPQDGRDERDAVRTLLAELPSLVGAFTREDMDVLALLARGERSTREFAVILGALHLSEGEQRREVKRVKDRIKRRLQRARRNHATCAPIAPPGPAAT